MSNPVPVILPQAFQAVYSALLPHREALNQADSERGKHGDDLLSIFAVLAAADESFESHTSLSALFARSAERAASISENPEAQFYAQGLTCFADTLRNLDLAASDLALYLRSTLAGTPDTPDSGGRVSQGQLLKALVKGLSAWDQLQANPNNKSSALSMGYLFDLGVDYLQALQTGATRLDAIVQAAIRNSPFRAPAYRAISGKLVLTTFLEAILRQDADNQN